MLLIKSFVTLIVSISQIVFDTKFVPSFIVVTYIVVLGTTNICFKHVLI